MDVFIGNLHPKARPNDLETFFKGYQKKTRFKIVTKYYEDGSNFRFGMAMFDDDKLAHKAIKKLNQQYLLGKPVTVREYYHRTYNNERRDLSWRNKEWGTNERRQADRRRKEVPAPAENELIISAYRDLAKKSI